MNPCPATRKDGSPCRTAPTGGATYCRWHAPELAQAHQEARRKGGASRARVKAEQRLAQSLAVPAVSGALQAVAQAAGLPVFTAKGLMSDKGLAEGLAGVANGVVKGAIAAAAGKTLVAVLAQAVELAKLSEGAAMRRELERRNDIESAKRSGGLRR